MVLNNERRIANPRTIDVTAAIFKDGNKILVARRASGQSLAQKWEFPGGKIEEGESPETCLARELLEEFGVQVKVGEFVCDSVYEYPGKRIRLMAYYVEKIAGEFALTVHDEIRWVERERLLEVDLAPADVPIARRMVVSSNR